ncbi:hypothetical protein ACFPYI_05080 [Halomarina salina]|uniref:DUF8159 domain-containing protein n=1 Tax=Halomarina salina TaxID=1872699 RepID=A0ABD5RJQ5_9EURY|nr:hypothetical protein [Halomarina salina]
MRRRHFVVSVAAATPLAAGCARPVESGSDTATKTPPKIQRQTPTSRLVPSLPVPEVKSIAESGVESAPDSVDGFDSFAAALDERGVDVVDGSEYETFVSLTQAVDSFADEGVARSLGVVAGTYATYVEAVDEPGPLSVTLEHEESTMGEYAVAVEWAEEYLADETTAKEYGEKVLGTVKTKTEK